MADYYVHFCATLDCQTAEKAQAALKLYKEAANALEDDLDADSICFDATLQNETVLFVTDLDGSVDLEQLEAWLASLGTDLGFTGRWGMTFAQTCTKHRADAFDGGAFVFDFDKGESYQILASSWAQTMLAGDTDELQKLADRQIAWARLRTAAEA